MFILFVVFYYFIQVIKRSSLVNVVGTIKIQFSSLLCITFNLSLTNSFGRLSTHILGYLEENSKFLRWVRSFRKQIKLFEDCVQGFLVFVAALYSSKTLSA